MPLCLDDPKITNISPGNKLILPLNGADSIFTGPYIKEQMDSDFFGYLRGKFRATFTFEIFKSNQYFLKFDTDANVTGNVMIRPCSFDNMCDGIGDLYMNIKSNQSNNSDVYLTDGKYEVSIDLDDIEININSAIIFTVTAKHDFHSTEMFSEPSSASLEPLDHPEL